MNLFLPQQEKLKNVKCLHGQKKMVIPGAGDAITVSRVGHVEKRTQRAECTVES